mmetsp:Transcript_14128/g.59008  ORF Transcript_14128/g.59008 Transcript_14128/m.59008 type:complete len:159 (+) Transcript_14128:495-971(+)
MFSPCLPGVRPARATSTCNATRPNSDLTSVKVTVPRGPPSEPSSGATSATAARPVGSKTTSAARAARGAAAAAPRRMAARMDVPLAVGVAVGVGGLALGLGVPIFFMKMEERDEQRLEEVRRLNRETLETTGETLSQEELKEMRPKRYLDSREFQDDD